MLSSNIFRFLDEPIYGAALYWPEDYHNGNKCRRNNFWTKSISVGGFEPNEIAIKEEKDEKGERKLVIHAKREKDGDFNEMRKCVRIPSNVDNEDVRTILTRDGNLILKARYKNSEDNNDLKALKLNRVDTWNGIWEELGRVNNQMSQLIDHHGSMGLPRTEYVANESGNGGTWRLRVNVGKDFKPNELKVRHLNNEIHLEGKKESKSENSWSSKYVNEVIRIPEGVDKSKLRSKLLNNGQLLIESECEKMPAIGTNEKDEGETIPVESCTNEQESTDKMAIDS
jgi:HSP20 family molecular chaperone IbpA